MGESSLNGGTRYGVADIGEFVMYTCGFNCHYLGIFVCLFRNPPVKL